MVRCSSISGISIFSSSKKFSCSTMYGLGEFSTGSIGVAALFFPCEMFLYEEPFGMSVFEVPIPLMGPSILCYYVVPPLNLRMRLNQ